MRKSVVIGGIIFTITILMIGSFAPSTIAESVKDSEDTKINCKIIGDSKDPKFQCSIGNNPNGTSRVQILPPVQYEITMYPLDCPSQLFIPNVNLKDFNLSELQGQWKMVITSCDKDQNTIDMNLDGREFSILGTL